MCGKLTCTQNTCVGWWYVISTIRKLSNKFYLQSVSLSTTQRTVFFQLNTSPLPTPFSSRYVRLNAGTSPVLSLDQCQEDKEAVEQQFGLVATTAAPFRLADRTARPLNHRGTTEELLRLAIGTTRPLIHTGNYTYHQLKHQKTAFHLIHLCFPTNARQLNIQLQYYHPDMFQCNQHNLQGVVVISILVAVWFINVVNAATTP